jgi:hypothetical protein
MRSFRFAPLLIAALGALAAAQDSPEHAPAAELDQILREWEQATRKIERLDCEFTRFRYDHTFEVEKRAEGTIALSRGGRARYQAVGVPVNLGAVARKLARNGAPYLRRPDEPCCLHWTGPQLYRIKDTEKTYEASDVPPNGKIRFLFNDIDVWDLFLAKPFLLGLPADELKEQFAVTILAAWPDEVRLKLVPRREEVALNYESATLLLDRHTMLTKAIKMRDPIGSETVHAFKDVSINAWAKRSSDDLSKPNLNGYQQLTIERAR